MVNERVKIKFCYGRCAMPLTVFTVLYGIFCLKIFHFALLFLPELGLLWIGFFITMPLRRFGRYRSAIIFAVLRYIASAAYLLFMMFTPLFYGDFSVQQIFTDLLERISIFAILLLPFIFLPLLLVIGFGGFLLGNAAYEVSCLIDDRKISLNADERKAPSVFRY